MSVRRGSEKHDGVPIWIAEVQSTTKDTAGRWSGVAVKQSRSGMLTEKQKEEFAREAYEYSKKMHGDVLEFPKWKGK